MPTAEARIAASFSSPPADWCAAARERSLYLDAPYLRYASRDHGEVFRAELRDAGALAAGVTGWLSQGTGHPYLEPRKLLGLPASDKPDLVLGCPGAFAGEMLLGSPAAGGAKTLADVLAAHAREVGAGDVLALYTDDDAADFWSDAIDSPPALINFDTVIDVPGSFDGWLQTLPRHRRGTIRRELRAFEQTSLHGGVTLDDAEKSAVLAELAPILVASEARFGNTMRADSVAATLNRQRTELGDVFTLFYVRDASGRLVAGATAFLEQGAVHVRWCGVDRESAGRHLEYFHVAYYLPLRFAAATGRTRVRLGLESFETKILRGARLEPRWALAITPVAGWHEQAARTSTVSVERLSTLLARFPESLAPGVRASLDRRLQPGAALARMRA